MDEQRRVVFNEGKGGHCHVWQDGTKRWEECATETSDPEKRKLNTWTYVGATQVCVICGREELLGGTILIPEGGDYESGEYILEPDGSRGMWVGGL